MGNDVANALVTGGSRGIGRAIARALAARGDRVAVHFSSDRASAEETLHQLSGEGHLVVAGDLRNPDAASHVVDAAVVGMGGIDVLVNNASIAPTDALSHQVGDVDYRTWQSVWQEMLGVNLVGAANLTYLVARHLIDRRAPGAIVNIGSRGAFRGEPEFPAYGSAKAGLHAFGQSMAVALAPHGISVASIAPGMISSERQADKLSGAGGDAICSQSPFGRVGTPEEVAEAVVYLTSPDAVWASGAILDFNGASYLRM